ATTDTGSGAAAGTTTGDPASGSGGGTGGFNIGGGSVGGGPSGVGCSSDLQSVVDEKGNVLEKCPPDKGCTNGVCVPACDAAAKSKGSIGCDFWGMDPPFLQNGNPSQLDGPCYAVLLANTWGRPAKITVERGGQSFDVTEFGRTPKGIAPSTTYD